MLITLVDKFQCFMSLNIGILFVCNDVCICGIELSTVGALPLLGKVGYRVGRM